MILGNISPNILTKMGFGQKNQQVYAELKSAGKMYLQKLLKDASPTNMVALLLVDIQNDFTRKNYLHDGKNIAGRLYVPGGESTILTNMALLEALIEMFPTLSAEQQKGFGIVVTQDAHRPYRTAATAGGDELDTLQSTYTDAKKIREGEVEELMPSNPVAGRFGRHCLVGTPGADIATPVEQLLAVLSEAGVSVDRFGKINFDASAAGMLLKKGVKMSNSANENIYFRQDSKSGLSFVDYMSKFARIVATGICGDVCVKQTVEGLASKVDGQSITVLAEPSHYLPIPNAVADTKSSFQGKGIAYKSLTGKEASNAVQWTGNVGAFLDKFAGLNEQVVGKPRLFSELLEPAADEDKKQNIKRSKLAQ